MHQQDLKAESPFEKGLTQLTLVQLKWQF